MPYIVQLKLNTTEHDRQLLGRRFFLMFRIHNACVSVGKKRLRIMKSDSSYNQLIQEYIARKKELTELKKENSVLLIESKEKEIKELSEKLKIEKQRLGLTKSEFEKFAKLMQRKHKDEVSSMQVQKEADRVFAGISKCMYSDAKEIHYKKYNDFNTISQKDDTNGIKIVDNKETDVLIFNEKYRTTEETAEEMEKIWTGLFSKFGDENVKKIFFDDNFIKSKKRRRHPNINLGGDFFLILH